MNESLTSTTRIDSVYSEQILASLRKIIRAVDLHSKQFYKQVGLTTPQFVVLKSVVNKPHSTVGEVARMASLSQATTSPIIDKLVNLDFLYRHRNPHDKRKSLLSPTEKGQTIIQTSPSPLHDHFIREVAQLSDWEKTLLLSSLQRVAHMMNADKLAAAPVLTDDELAPTDNTGH